MHRVSKTAIIARIADQVQVRPSVVRAVVEELFTQIKDEVAAGNLVTFTNFGSFRQKAASGALIHYPQNPQSLGGYAPAQLPKFKASPAFKKACQKEHVPIETVRVVRNSDPEQPEPLIHLSC